MRKKILDAMARRLTVLIIPPTQLKPRRWQCSTGFFIFWMGLWSIMTVCAGVVVGPHVASWLPKADIQVTLAKMPAWPRRWAARASCSIRPVGLTASCAACSL